MIFFQIGIQRKYSEEEEETTSPTAVASSPEKESRSEPKDLPQRLKNEGGKKGALPMKES